MSKTKGRSDIILETKLKTFWYRSQNCLIENRLFRFGPESALLDLIEMIFFDGADSGTNSALPGMVSFLLDVITFVERLFL